MYREAILSGQPAASHPPLGAYGSVLCEIIHLITGWKWPKAGVGQHQLTRGSVQSSYSFNSGPTRRREHANFLRLRKGELANELTDWGNPLSRAPVAPWGQRSDFEKALRCCSCCWNMLYFNAWLNLPPEPGLNRWNKDHYPHFAM